MRMLFHFLVGVLSLGWTSWPPELSHGHGPGWPQQTTCLDKHDTACVQDVFLSGTRLTCTWADYNDDPHPTARLQQLANDSLSLPDAVVVSIGAWHAMHRRNETVAYGRAVDSLLRQVDEMLFPPRTGSDLRAQLSANGIRHRIFAATTSCARAWPQPDSATRLISHFNNIARRRVAAAAQNWMWFDREVVTGWVCKNALDCAGFGKHISSRFHPSGRALNVLVNQLAEVVGASPVSAQ